MRQSVLTNDLPQAVVKNTGKALTLKQIQAVIERGRETYRRSVETQRNTASVAGNPDRVGLGHDLRTRAAG